MIVDLYNPEKMYGFVVEGDLRVFFHQGDFLGGHWEGLDSPPPPIIGEEVVVSYVHNASSDSGKAPRAKAVQRIHPPRQILGKVESFNPERGWGFVRGSDHTTYYLHRSEVPEGRLPLPGQEVLFFAGFKNNRPRACYVRLLQLRG